MKNYLKKKEAINSQKRLLIEEMNDLVNRRMERGDFKGKRIEILDKLSELDREEKELEGLSKTFENDIPIVKSESVFSQQRKRKLLEAQSEQLKTPKISQEIIKDTTAINSPHKIEEKYRSESVGTAFHIDSPNSGIPIAYPKKSGDSYWEINYPAVPESSASSEKNEDEDRKREEILLKVESIKRQKRLLIDEMNDCVDRGFLGKRKEILDKIIELDRQSSVNVPSTNDTAINSPPRVENKYQKEYVGTTFHNDSIMDDRPIKSLNWYAIIILLILISSTLYFVIGNSNSQNTNLVMPSNFNNDNAEKVTNPILTPKDSFDKINEYREQNKKYKILWSDDASRLADFRASDMVKRNYFSRTTPDGKTVSDYIGKYNFYSDSAWGENLCKGCSDPAQTWIESAGHREVLLGGWGKGAVACESDICVFIGVNE